MKTTQISPSVESHTEEPLWQEFTEQEQEKICGGRLIGQPTSFRVGNWSRVGSWPQRNGRVIHQYQRPVTVLVNNRIHSMFWQTRYDSI